MKLDSILIFILPVCDFSLEESQNLSLDELNELWVENKITKYKLSGFMQDINDDYLVDNTNNWIIMKIDNEEVSIRQAV